MRIAICDDSKHDRESLHENIKLTEVASNFDYSLFPSGEKLLSAVSSGETFEIVFLDNFFCLCYYVAYKRIYSFRMSSAKAI